MAFKADAFVEKIVGAIVLISVGSGLAGAFLSSLTNLSGSGLPLLVLFGAGGILAILYSVFIFRGVFKSLK